MDNNKQCDVVVVGSGVAGALIAKRLAERGLKVIILEAGRKVPPNINVYMNTFFRAAAKVPESPYPPDLFADPAKVNAGRPTSLMIGSKPEASYLIQQGPQPFGSTYERAGGGTALHWLGTSLRLLPSDLRMSAYDKKLFVDWPIDYKTLTPYYAESETELGVSANAEDQSYLGADFPKRYPMPGMPTSRADEAVAAGLARLKPDDLAFLGLNAAGLPLKVTATPAARNSQPYQSRRVCAGNTNCIPICPIQAKYDPTVTLAHALDTGNVEIMYQTVAKEVVISKAPAANGTHDVARIDYLQYGQDMGPITARGSISAKSYVIAANGIETPRLLLMSKNEGRTPNGVANGSDQVGRNLMDHPYYVAWALTQDPVFPYRGPLSTAGVEDLVRDGPFRRERGAFRVEIGNEGWNFVVGGSEKGSDPGLTTLDLINGVNYSGVNGGGKPLALFGDDLTKQLNHFLTRQIRLGFLIEQNPDPANRVTLSDKFTDGLGLSRPQIHYDLSDYTKKGVAAAKQTADVIFRAMNAKQFTKPARHGAPMTFDWPIDGKMTAVRFMGAGHIMGTYRMGEQSSTSVVDPEQRCWEHRNLYLVGSGTFPTTATANPTLTIAALALRTAKTIAESLGAGHA